MDLYLMIGILGIIYILIFGGMSLLRREGLSFQFAIEALMVTAIAELFIVILHIPIHPVLFIALLYLVTLRIRIIVDVANGFARRGNYPQAERIYHLAYRLRPDQTSKLIIDINYAVMLLQENRLDEAIQLFNEVLQQSQKGYLGVKYEAAGHFNLGVAYLRQENHSKATIEFNTTIDTWPGSLYAQRAQQAIDRQRQKEKPAAE
jgi:tetratricopeptide (TPR) repeat protein